MAWVVHGRAQGIKSTDPVTKVGLGAGYYTSVRRTLGQYSRSDYDTFSSTPSSKRLFLATAQIENREP